MGCGASAAAKPADASGSPLLRSASTRSSTSSSGEGRGPQGNKNHGAPAASRANANGASAACQIIPNRYSSYSEVAEALRSAGLEASQLIVGIDFTKSNTWTGEHTFGGLCLHDSRPGMQTLYEQVMNSVCTTLEPFDEDNLIPTFGFGDKRTKNKQVFSFLPYNEPCKGLEQCAARYKEIAKHLLGPPLGFSGPTSFAPLIRQAMELVRSTGEYHILVIIADGQVDSVAETVNAIVDASRVALSIIMVGVGDGPWERMEEFDDGLPERVFDNFQFVEFASLAAKYPREKRDFAFAAQALMEMPDQYQTVLNLGYLAEGYHENIALMPPKPSMGPPDISEPAGEPCGEDMC